MTYEYTVLDDWSTGSEMSHREMAEELLPKLREEMSEEEYQIEFTADVRKAVLDSILRDLSSNLKADDWYGRGFQYPEDYLNAEAVGDAIGDTARRYFENDQIGKSWDVTKVILEYAEEYDLVERDE